MLTLLINTTTPGRVTKSIRFPFNVYDRVTKKIKLPFNVIGDVNDGKRYRFMPPYLRLPKPGQWLYVQSDVYGVPETLVKVGNVSIKQLKEDVFTVVVDINRIPLKEDIILAKLARQQILLIEDEQDVTNPLDLVDAIQRSELFSPSVLVRGPAYSGVNYSGNEFSGDV